MPARHTLLLPAVALAAFLGGASSCAPADDALDLSAASSLRGALEEVNTAFERETGTRVRMSTGGSGTLAVQIERGAPCDVFFPAGALEAERLVSAGLADPSTRVEVLTNTLVVVVPTGASEPSGPDDLRDVARLSIANPDAVPAGRYAREWLRGAGLWDAAAARVMEAPNVRAALAAVESGGADAGIVYRTDAARSARVRIAWEIRADAAPSIGYPALATVGADASAARYLEFLASDAATDAFRRHGFGLPAGP